MSGVKTTDRKGRVTLGQRFANRQVIVQKLNESEVVIKLARVIPEREAWLYENPEALAAVRTGLAQARGGKLSKGPNVDADNELAAQLDDDAQPVKPIGGRESSGGVQSRLGKRRRRAVQPA